MAKFNLLLVAIVLLTSASIYPTLSISRWFSSSFHDLHFTLRRYAHCYTDLVPITSSQFNETDYLVDRVKVFLDEANYDNEQMANVTSFLDSICRPDWSEQGYAVSQGIDVDKRYNGTHNKLNRCKALDEAMDAMFYVLRRAALNRSEPLDFSVVKWPSQVNITSATYNLTDLINVSWIKSDLSVDNVCAITDPIKAHVIDRQSKSIVQKRNQQQSSTWRNFMDYINSILNGILGYQRRFYWESTSLLSTIQARVGNSMGTIRDGLGKGISGARKRLSDLVSGQPVNKTQVVLVANRTNSFPANFNSTNKMSVGGSTTTTSATTTTTSMPITTSQSSAVV